MTKTVLKGAIAAVAVLAGAQVALAEGGLVINGELEMIIEAPAADHLKGSLTTVYSGWVFRDVDTQAMQMDDFDNPGMLYVDQGEGMWNAPAGTSEKSCADCHGDASESMAGVRTVYPKWNEAAGEVRSLQMQINACRTENQGADAFKYGKDEINAMEAYISMQSRGMPMNVAIDGPAASAWEQGKEMYYARTGQLELSCANCHEDNYDNYIRADHLSQGQTNGFPVYRLKDTKLTSAAGRFVGCVRDTRAETYKIDSAEFVALELYVASRGNGLSVEGVSVRN
ncbi:MAG: sulfur oxidation c-type cytochrome SoxA [Marivivens sp.]|jgi:sulfur-oxidizing protein SoxA|nr:sulfur oxidation c-type cytochrome SoxA [Paracoccaceae bacterium]